MLIKVDKDASFHYENVSLPIRILARFLLLPFLNILPFKGGTFLVTKSSRTASAVHKLSKTSNALEFLYTFDGKFHIDNSFLDGIFTYFWQNIIINTKAVRNRIKLVKRELKKSVLKVYSSKSDTVNIFSLASGSARAVLEIMGELKQEGIPIKAKLLDLSPDAIALSKKIARQHGVSDLVSYHNDKVSNFLKYCDNWTPDIIEMVGFLDYLNQEKAINISKDVYRILSNNGMYITCNIKDNYEHKFISKVIEWEMIYRDEHDLEDVLIKSGFDSNKCKIIYEPTLIHGLAIGEK